MTARCMKALTSKCELSLPPVDPEGFNSDMDVIYLAYVPTTHRRRPFEMHPSPLDFIQGWDIESNTLSVLS